MEGVKPIGGASGVGAVRVETLKEADESRAGPTKEDGLGALGGKLAAEVGISEAPAFEAEDEGAVLLFKQAVGLVDVEPMVIRGVGDGESTQLFAQTRSEVEVQLLVEQILDAAV